MNADLLVAAFDALLGDREAAIVEASRTLRRLEEGLRPNGDGYQSVPVVRLTDVSVP